MSTTTNQPYPLRDEPGKDAMQRAGVVEAEAREVVQAVRARGAQVPPRAERDATAAGVESVIAHVGSLRRHLVACCAGGGRVTT